MNILRASYWTALLLLHMPIGAHGLAPLPEADQAALRGGVHNFMDCADCHFAGAPDRIPRSRIPVICGDCHPKAARDYMKSVHWQGGKAVTVCVDCHGIHGIARVRRPESKAYRSLVCGSCHIGSAEHFGSGPHQAGMEKTGALACASCHSNHNVQRPEIAQMAPACAQCHPRTTSSFAMGQRVTDRFAQLRDTFAVLDREIGRAEADGLEIRAALREKQVARAGMLQTRLVWHGLDEAAIGRSADRALEAVGRVRKRIEEERETFRLRRLGLAVAWTVILANVWMLYTKLRQLDVPRLESRG